MRCVIAGVGERGFRVGPTTLLSRPSPPLVGGEGDIQIVTTGAQFNGGGAGARADISSHLIFGVGGGLPGEKLKKLPPRDVGPDTVRPRPQARAGRTVFRT